MAPTDAELNRMLRFAREILQTTKPGSPQHSVARQHLVKLRHEALRRAGYAPGHTAGILKALQDTRAMFPSY